MIKTLKTVMTQNRKKAMAKTKKEAPMQIQTSTMPPVPVAKSTDKKLMQAEIRIDLYQAVDMERKKRKLKKREVLEYGLLAFLMSTNPTAASKIDLDSK